MDFRHAILHNRFVNFVRPAFYFAAAKFVLIKDWRLGMILRASQAAIVVYVLWDLFTKESYLVREVPVGSVTTFAEQGNFTVANIAKLSDGSARYCNDSRAYEFYFNSDFVYQNISCVYQPLGANAHSSFNGLFLATYFTEDKVITATRPSAAQCPAAATLLAGAEYQGYLAGACIYRRRRHYFPLAPELATLAFVHSYSTSIVKLSGSLPRTSVRLKGSTRELHVFEEGEEVRLPIAEWLRLGEVDLDRPYDQQGEQAQKSLGVLGPANQGREWSKGKLPMTRLAGLQVVLNVNFYNYKLGPGGSLRKKHEVRCIIEIEPRLQWTNAGSDVRYLMAAPQDPVLLSIAPGGGSGLSDGGGNGSDAAAGQATSVSTDYYRQGVSFVFKFGGVMGTFGYQEAIRALVEGSVLLGLAQLAVVFIALYTMGLRSKLYYEFMKESCDYRREYARFAAQALVAAWTFKMLDKDGTGELDRREVLSFLRDVMGRELEEEALVGLTDFLCNYADQDELPKHGRSRAAEAVENTISLSEWINIFTDEKASVESLRRIIDQHYRSKQSRLDHLMHLARGYEKDEEGADKPAPPSGSGGSAGGMGARVMALMHLHRTHGKGQEGDDERENGSVSGTDGSLHGSGRNGGPPAGTQPPPSDDIARVDGSPRHVDGAAAAVGTAPLLVPGRPGSGGINVKPKNGEE